MKNISKGCFCRTDLSMAESELLRACCKEDLMRLLPQVRNPADVRGPHEKTLLHYSCRHGWLCVTRRLVEQYHCDTESRDRWGDTPLHVACRKGHVDIVKYLVSEQGCTTVCQNKDGDTPLHLACRKGNLAMVEILLTGQDCSTACNKHSNILIHYSCQHGWLDVTRRLVDQYHGDPESRDQWGDTPLHEACYEGHRDIVKYLVSEKGCSTACQNMWGDTPLHVACHNDRVDIVRYLVIERRCSTGLQNEDGDTPLHVACRRRHLAMVKTLSCGQDCKTALNSPNKDGNNPLHVSYHKDHLDIVRYLVIEQGCSTAGQNEIGDTLLHVACREGHLAMVKALTSVQGCKAACKCLNKGGVTPLHEACRKGHVDIVRYLVSEQGCSIASQNKIGHTPLHVACREGHLAVAEILLTGQDCSTAYSKHTQRLVHYSCYHGWLDMTRWLVEQCHCDPESRDWWSDTPLHVVCREGHVDVVKYLVSEQGCSTACQNTYGDTPLHLACRRGNLAMFEVLLTGQDCSTACNKHSNILTHYSCQHGWLDVTRRLVEQYHSDPESRDRWGDTPLHVVCREGHVDIVKYLVSEQGCSTACQNTYGDTPLHLACRRGNLAMFEVLLTGQDCSTACNKHSNILTHCSCQHGWLDVTRRLVDQYHGDPESRDRWGDTPLHVACYEGHVDIVKYLVSEQGCSTACQNTYGDTPLHVACRKGHVEIVKYLVSEQGCSTGLQNKKGDTPLHVACCEGHVDIVKYLVSKQGCSTACQNTYGDTPLHLACRRGNLAMFEVLLTGQDCSTACNKHSNILTHCSCQHGWLDVTRRLVDQYHGDPESRDRWDDTPLHVACYEGHVDIVKYLVSEQGCSTACRNTYGDTPLHVACRKGHVEIVKYLVSEQGCSTGLQNEDGDTPLHVACRRRHLAMVIALSCGQDCKVACNRQDKKGNTPLHVACCEGHVDIVWYLVIERGCSTAGQNKDGNTPLHVACCWDRSSVVQLLLSTGRVDPWCKNARNQTPKQLTHNYAIAKIFAGLTQKANLVTTIKVFVFGNPAAGKSTLVKVIENKVTSRFGALAGQFRNVSGVELTTAGINAVTIQNSRLGTVTVYDLAGQFEYYASHDALVENLMSSSSAIFIAVVKLSESEAEVIRTLRYWISFIENCCGRVEATAHLMVVGSWADKVKEAGELNIDQKWLNIKKACISSSSVLHFIGFTALDCRKLASSGLDKICDMIGSSCTALREAKEQKEIIYPHLLHAFISTKLSSEVACSVRKLCALITAEDDTLLPTEQNLLSPLLSTLSDGGHLLYLANKEDFKAGWVVINKQAVLSEINGTVFAPENFIQHHDMATSTGVVPKSKIAGVFAEKYNIDMILGVLTLFEFCQKIKDSFTLSLIASSDPTRDDAAAMTTSDDSSESYYFFPALVRVEHPTDVWQSSSSGQYQCGWCLQCSKEGQYLTPRFLHVLLLRLAFSLALAPERSQQDKASPVLRKRCAIWKNGIQWLDQDGVESIVEVMEQNKFLLLMMSCPEGEEMACVRLRSSLISKILGTKKELCSGISTTELLIDPSNLSSYPLPSSSELTLYTSDQVVNAVRERKQFVVNITGRRRMKLVDALHFEPYHGMHTRLIDKLLDKDLANQEVDDVFLHDLAANIHPKLMQQAPIKIVLQMFNISDDRLFYNSCDQFPDEKDNPTMRCFRLLLTWKNCDSGGSTYQSLHTILDKYSIFCGRNPIVDSSVSEH